MTESQKHHTAILDKASAPAPAAPDAAFKLRESGLGPIPAPKKHPALKVQWVNRRVKTVELQDYDRNPRTCTETAYRRLKKGIKETGYHTPILATHDLRIVAGHVRKKALLELGVYEVDVRVPTEPLTDDQFKQVLIQSNLNAGKWDQDILGAEFEMDDLIEMGMPSRLLGADDEDVLHEAGESAGGEAPASEPREKCPHCGQKMPKEQ